MSEQSRLFITDIYDALGDLVRAAGGPKSVGEALYPKKQPDDAAGYVKDCLNRARRETFDAEEIMWLLRRGRELGCHEPMRWICANSGYTAPEPLEQETELARLLREYIDLEAKRQGLQPKIDELRAKLRVA
jgi:hypothetical protein